MHSPSGSSRTGSARSPISLWKLPQLYQEASAQKTVSPSFTTSRSSQGWFRSVPIDRPKHLSAPGSLPMVLRTYRLTETLREETTSPITRIGSVRISSHRRRQRDRSIPRRRPENHNRGFVRLRTSLHHVHLPMKWTDSNTTVRSAFRQSSMLPLAP